MSVIDKTTKLISRNHYICDEIRKLSNERNGPFYASPKVWWDALVGLIYRWDLYPKFADRPFRYDRQGRGVIAILNKEGGTPVGYVMYRYSKTFITEQEGSLPAWRFTCHVHTPE